MKMTAVYMKVPQGYIGFVEEDPCRERIRKGKLLKKPKRISRKL